MLEQETDVSLLAKLAVKDNVVLLSIQLIDPTL